MNEMRSRIETNPAISQLQRSMANGAQTDPWNEKVERLSFYVIAVPCSTPTLFHEQRVILRGPISGDDMNFTVSAE